MNAGIITYHFTYNCGATLQCLALQTKLQQLGHDVQVINYRPWYHQNRYIPQRNIPYAALEAYRASERKFPKNIKDACIGIKKTYKFNIDKEKTDKFRISEKKFTPFVKKYLNETRLYRTVAGLKAFPPKCDVIFSGSDQLWNTALTNGYFDEAYFVTFAAENTKRATYAVGANFSDDAHTTQQLKELAAGMDAISLRETKYMRTVSRLKSEKTILHQDLDPTLLLQQKDYAPFEADESCIACKKPYILTYTMGDASQGKVYSAARKLSEKLGIPAIDITGNPIRGANIMGVDSVKVGPDEFLTYVKNAAYVIVNSFHGTAFSVIYHKQFMVVPHSSTGNRVTDLLERIGLSDRWKNTSDECVSSIEDTIDYSAVDATLAELRAESVSYISSLCGE